MSTLRSLPQENLESIGRAMRAIDAHYLTDSIERDWTERMKLQARYMNELTRVCVGLGPDALLSMLRVVSAALDGYEDMNWGDRPQDIDGAMAYLSNISSEREFQESAA